MVVHVYCRRVGFYEGLTVLFFIWFGLVFGCWIIYFVGDIHLIVVQPPAFRVIIVCESSKCTVEL